MIPQCYPSVVNPVTGSREMQVYILSSVSGLVRWTDYIPIKLTDANPLKENTTSSGGYIPMKALSSTSGYKSWVDYVPVYVDASATDAWQCSNVGFIPYSYGKTLDLNFLTSPVPSTVTFTRGSGGGYFGSDGLFKWQGYNLLTYSQDFGNAAWATKTSITLTSGVSDPFGGNNAFTLQNDVLNSGVLQQVVTGSSATAYTGSIWVRRRVGTGQVSIRVAELAASPITITSTWTRVSYTNTSTTTTIRLGLFFSGGAVGDQIDIYGAQLEQGSFSTPNQYSPTTTAANSSPRLDYDPATPAGTTGVELVTNGDFSNGSTGWTLSQPTSGLVSVSGGQATIETLNGTYASVVQAIPVTVGKTYKATVTCLSVSGSNPQFALGAGGSSGVGSVVFSSAGTYTVNIVASISNLSLEIKRLGGSTLGSATIDNISVQEVTFAPRGLLVEEQRVNLLFTSNSFNNNAGASAATITQNALGPDGIATSAWTVTESATGANQYAIAATGGTATAAVHTASAFVKAGTNTRCQIALNSAASTDYADFLLTGAGSVTAATTLANCSIVALAGGWYRIAMVFTSAATGCSVVVGHINSATDTRIPTYTGTSRTLYLFGAQLELGSFSTSYIPTSGASATRSADSVSMTGTNFSSWWNQSAGTLYTEFSVPVTPSATSRAAQISGTAGFDCLITSGMINQYKINAAFVGVGTTRSINTVIKSIGAFDTTTAGINVDGVTEVTSANAPSANTALYIGSAGGTSSFLNGHIRRLMFYPVKFDNATRKALTA